MMQLHLKLKFRGKPVVERVHQSPLPRSRVDPLGACERPQRFMVIGEHYTRNFHDSVLKTCKRFTATCSSHDKIPQRRLEFWTLFGTPGAGPLRRELPCQRYGASRTLSPD